MKIDWKKKFSVTLKWLGPGLAFLFYLIFIQNMKIFENGLLEGIFLSLIFIIMPSCAIFVFYWPIDKKKNH